MKCLKCNKPAKQQYVDKRFCNSCYTSLIERLVRKQFRLEKKVRKGMRILALDDAVLYFLNRIISMPVELVKRSSSSFGIKRMHPEVYTNAKLKEFIKQKKIDTVVLPWTLDDEAEGFLEGIMSAKKIEPDNKRFIKLFCLVSRKDIAEFCKIRKVRFKEQKSSPVGTMLDRMEKKYPGTKNSVLKSSRQMALVGKIATNSKK